MKNDIKNKQGGFLQLILFIVIVVFLMSYFNLTLSGIWNWFVTMFNNIL